MSLSDLRVSFPLHCLRAHATCPYSDAAAGQVCGEPGHPHRQYDAAAAPLSEHRWPQHLRCRQRPADVLQRCAVERSEMTNWGGVRGRGAGQRRNVLLRHLWPGKGNWRREIFDAHRRVHHGQVSFERELCHCNREGVMYCRSVFSADDTASRWILSQDAVANQQLSRCRCVGRDGRVHRTADDAVDADVIM